MATKPTITIRPTILSDLPAIVDLNREANASHPIIDLAFSKAPTLEEGQKLGNAVFIGRYTWMLEHPGIHQFYSAIATLEDGKEEIVGFLVGTRPKRYKEDGELEEGEDVEWQPVLPEGTNVPFFQYFLSMMMMDKEQYHVEKLWELESLSISPNYQRMGIGHKLISTWLETYVDAESGKGNGQGSKGTYLRSSAKGRGLYEKFGWKVKSSSKIDLTDWVGEGDKVEKEKVCYENWNMIREPLGSSD